MFIYIDYLPEFLRDIKQLAAIGGAADEQAALLQLQTDQLLANRLISTADLATLQRWEKLLGLSYNPVYSLAERRQQVISRLRMQSVITLEKLTDLLDDLTNGDTTVTMDYANYTLTVLVALSNKYNFNNIDNLLHDVVPANIVIDLSLIFRQYSELTAFTHAQLGTHTHRELREEAI